MVCICVTDLSAIYRSNSAVLFAVHMCLSWALLLRPVPIKNIHECRKRVMPCYEYPDAYREMVSSYSSCNIKVVTCCVHSLLLRLKLIVNTMLFLIKLLDRVISHEFVPLLTVV